jgi:hypothetical protein
MTRRSQPFHRTLWALLIAAIAFPAAAQYEDDDQTRDWENQDRRYQERLEHQDEEPLDPLAAEEAYLKKVEQLIRDKNYGSAESDHYRVQSDDPRLDAKAATRLLESFRAFFDEFWSAPTELLPYDKTSRVFLFYSFFKYNQMLGADFRMSSLRPAGHYGSLYDAITLHSDAGSAADLANTLIHEAAHQMVDQRLDWGDGGASPWLGEGLASYFGYTLQDKTGAFQPGAVGRKSVALLRGAGKEAPRQAGQRLRAARKALKNADPQQGSTIEGLVWIRDSSRFYSGNPDVNYGLSWLLVHYLMHADDGQHTVALIAYIDQLRAGVNAPGELFEALGMTGVQLDQALIEHAKSIKIQ